MLQRIYISLLLLLPFAAFSQARVVSGTVLSAKEKEPLPGASVSVKGTTKGVVTNIDGQFKLEINDPAATTLLVSFIGMVPQEIPVSTSPITVLLESSSRAIDEVVVIAYGATKKSSYTGSIAQIKGDQLENRQVSNVSKALQGLAAGVQSTSASGQPGTEATIRIRGVGSINASSDPLYVVDGVPYSGSISAINPYDIASVSVLKDAASSALYGSRGANGVIIITTKQGKKSKDGSTIDVRVSQGFSKRAVEDYKQMNTNQYFELYWEALRNKGLSDNLTPDAAARLASSNIISDLGINPYGAAYPQPVGLDGKIVPGASPLWNDNWSKALQRTGQRTEANLSISGATDKSRYFISGGYLNDQGIYLGSGFKRYNVRSNIDLDAKDWLKVGTNISAAHADQAYPPSEDSRSDNVVNYGRLIPGFYPIYKRNVNDGTYQLDANGNKQIDYGDYRPSAANPRSNLLGTINLDKSQILRDDVSARVYAEATIWDKLKFKTSYNADYTTSNSHFYTNPAFGFNAPIGGTVDKGNTRTFSWTFNNIFTYEKTFNKDHHINLLAGQEAYSYGTRFVTGSRQGFALLGFDEPVAASQLNDFTGFSDSYKLASYLGRAEYDYQQRYYFSASLRRDGSSRFSPDNRWGTFWSVGASWKLAQEAWLKETGWLDALTLRASYGGQGNDNIGSYYAYKSLYVINNNLGEGGTYRDSLYNPRLKWETNLNLNLGVDFAMLDNRISGSVEYFQRKSKDLLYSLPLALSTGYDAIDENIGSLKNMGVELQLRGVPVRNRDFSWTVDLNVTHYKNKITELPQKEIISGTKKLMVGTSIYDFFIREWAGVDPENGKAQWFVTGTDGKKTKTYIYADGTQYYSGSALPDVYGGFTNTFDYKGLSFSFLITYSLGGKILDNDVTFLMHNGNNPGRAWHEDMLNRWTPQHKNTDIPVLTTDNSGWTQTSTRFLYDATYGRLKSVNLSYTLPKSILDKARLNRVTVYLQGENLLTWYNHKGMDPEQAVNGVTYYRYPAVKSVSAGLNLSF